MFLPTSRMVNLSSLQIHLIDRKFTQLPIIIAEQEARRIIVLRDSGPCECIYMSVTDMGGAPLGAFM